MSFALRRRYTAVALAWLGALSPGPIPLSGLHKFYLGQPVWGGIYLLLGWTQMPRVACAIEGLWLLTRPLETLQDSALSPGLDPTQVSALATALRELDSLRQEGLISEAEFEQKRRHLLDQLGTGA
ncbi:MAG: SHOCT domain-containing protein [Cyanobacteriota bacterium]|nr:SHOCT domain-containing protein [Cyanobacteriota bacterium]